MKKKSLRNKCATSVALLLLTGRVECLILFRLHHHSCNLSHIQLSMNRNDTALGWIKFLVEIKDDSLKMVLLESINQIQATNINTKLITINNQSNKKHINV